MKETGGYFRSIDHAIEWRCNELSCGEENLSPVRFANGTHILTCIHCKTKRKVTVIGRLNQFGIVEKYY